MRNSFGALSFVLLAGMAVNDTSAASNGLMGPVQLSGNETIVAEGFRLADPDQVRGIRLYLPDGSGPVDLTDYTFDDSFPSWTPDGQQIVFTRQLGAEDNTKEIMIMNVNATGLRQLTNNSYLDDQPHVSPDGETIAFHRTTVTGRGNRTTTRDDIYTMNIKGKKQKNVTADLPGGRKYSDPRWSPDGTKIIFISRLDVGPSNNSADIYTINPGGGELTRLTSPSEGVDSDPAFDSAHSRIAFARLPKDFVAQLVSGNWSSDWKIMTKDLTNLAEAELIQGQLYCCTTWRPDGSGILFLGNVDDSQAPGGFSRDILEVTPGGFFLGPLVKSYDFIETYAEIRP